MKFTDKLDRYIELRERNIADSLYYEEKIEFAHLKQSIDETIDTLERGLYDLQCQLRNGGRNP